jgi:two-component system response regulator AtoC
VYKRQKKLLGYSFPGNIRELKSVIEVAIVLSENTIITEQDILFSQKSTETAPLQLTLEEHAIAIIQKELNTLNGNVLKTSQRLAIGKSTIYRYIKEGKVVVNH